MMEALITNQQNKDKGKHQMPSISFTKENMLERERLEPSWYELEVLGFEEKLSKGGDSTNFVGSFKVASGAKVGTPIRLYFNEKAIGRIVDYMQAHGAKEQDMVGKPIIDVLTRTVGRKISGFCKFDPEFKWNTIEDFKPIAKASA
jgi:hypothetical protein